MATIKTRILIISDTHGTTLTEDGHKELVDEPFRLPLPTADLLIHCGDLTMTGTTQQYHKTLDMLRQIDATVKLVIAGNHDLSLDLNFVSSHRDDMSETRQPQGMNNAQAQQRWQAARDLWISPQGRAQAEGVTFLDEGVHIVPLANGASAKVYASPYTPSYMDWAFSYESQTDRFNSRKTSFKDATNIAESAIPTRTSTTRPVDVVITHGPAWQRLDSTQTGEPVGCPHLLQALMRSRPLVFCCGHIHEAWGGERVRWADNANSIDFSKTSVSKFKDSGWREGVANDGEAVVSLCDVDQEDVKARHAVYKDLSSSSNDPICAGKETAFINAAIMDLTYNPTNAPWLLDIDLPA